PKHISKELNLLTSIDEFSDTWDYRIVSWGKGGPYDETFLARELHRLGADGWEFCAARGDEYIFKRAGQVSHHNLEARIYAESRRNQELLFLRLRDMEHFIRNSLKRIENSLQKLSTEQN
ncbi:MAG: hypothetical protein QGG54_19755, partial [Gammaproteobacteria bacterium]|nr:hypothetical protein [Gammaproteobacteria bacterium]